MPPGPQDPQVLAVVKAIRQVETGGDYNNRTGDSGSSAGAYQWNNDGKPLKPGESPSHWKNAAGQYLGDSNAPMTRENQNKVAYSQVDAYKKQGLSPLEIDALWNGAHKDVGTGKYVHNNSQRATKFQEALQQEAGQQGGGLTSPLPQLPQEPLGATPPDQGGIGNGIVDTAKRVGNFFFPAVADVYHDIKGDSTKTGLQQAGDVALTALPFIPGLGELGMGARTGTVLAKGAGLGYGAGVASNLSQGQSVDQAIQPQMSNLAGAALGGAAPLATKAVGGLIKGASGISGQMQHGLSQINDVKEYDRYINAVKARNVDARAPSPLNLGADEMDKALATIKQKLKAQGAEVGKANQAAEAIAVDPSHVENLANKFNAELADRFGIKLATTDKGKLVLTQTRRGGVALTPAEQQRVVTMGEKLNEIGNNGNVRMMDDLMTELDKKHDYGVKGKDPLSGLFGTMRHDVNEVAREHSPQFAAANDKVSELKRLKTELEGMAGKNMQKGELLMRRVFSGDKNGEVNDLFQKIKDATGIDLVDHAHLAKHAIDSLGNDSQKTLLHQIFDSANKEGGRVIPTMIGMARGALQKTVANPERIGRNIVNGKKPGLIPGLVTKAAARAGSALSTQ